MLPKAKPQLKGSTKKAQLPPSQRCGEPVQYVSIADIKIGSNNNGKTFGPFPMSIKCVPIAIFLFVSGRDGSNTGVSGEKQCRAVA